MEIMKNTQITRIKLNGFYTYLLPAGNELYKFLTDALYEKADNFETYLTIDNRLNPKLITLARVETEQGYKFLLSNGTYLHNSKNEELTFISASSFDSQGFSLVETEQGFNLINLKGDFICVDEDNEAVFYDELSLFRNGFATAKNQKGACFVDINTGKIYKNLYFKTVFSWNRNYVLVETFDKGWAFLDRNGEFIDNSFFEKITLYDDYYYCITTNEKFDIKDNHIVYLNK